MFDEWAGEHSLWGKLFYLYDGATVLLVSDYGTHFQPERNPRTRGAAYCGGCLSEQLPEVSVVMPVRNGARFIAEALESVLAQESVNLEVVVVDDGSSDKTRERIAEVADERVRVIAGPEKGVAAAMNAGLAAARGRFVARCDGDDRYLPPQRLSRQLEILRGMPEFGAVCGQFEALDHDGSRVKRMMGAGEQARELTGDLRSGRVEAHFCTYLTRREPLLATGGFRSYFSACSDIDFQLLLCEKTRVWYEPQTWYGYRLHDDSITHRNSRRLLDFYEGMARTLQEQRASRRVGDMPGSDDLDMGCATPPPAMKEQSKRDDAREQVWRLRWAEAWRLHGQGRQVSGILAGFQVMMLQPWRLGAWRNVAVLCAKSTPLLRRFGRRSKDLDPPGKNTASGGKRVEAARGEHYTPRKDEFPETGHREPAGTQR